MKADNQMFENEPLTNRFVKFKMNVIVSLIIVFSDILYWSRFESMSQKDDLMFVSSDYLHYRRKKNTNLNVCSFFS